YGKYKHIYMLDFIRDMRVLDMLRCNSYVYLHGHSAGGTNPSLVEAMNLGLPIISFDVVFNRETTESKAIFFDSAEKLLAELRQLTPESREATGRNMREVAQRRYTWKIISEQYATSIEKSLLGDGQLGEMPDAPSAV
ncbi:MAG: glycosyltransferase, partial [Bacteroidota bacterium]